MSAEEILALFGMKMKKSARLLAAGVGGHGFRVFIAPKIATSTIFNNFNLKFMSLILLISFIPTHPPTAGNSVRILKQAELLRQLGHHVYYAFLSDGNSGDFKSMHQYWGDYLKIFHYQNPALPHVSFFRRVTIKICNILKVPLFKWPALKSTYDIDEWYNDNLTPKLIELIRSINPSTVVVEYVFFSKILNYIPNQINKIIDAHDIFSDRNSRADSQWFSTNKYQEAIGLNRAHTVIAIQTNDAEYFKSISKTNVITIGHQINITNSPRSDINPDIHIGYIGSHNTDNVIGLHWFFKNVFSFLDIKKYRLKFTIIGSVCRHLNNLPPEVECINFIENLNEAYSKFDIVINPAQRGTGLKIKTIEALGFGKPLLTTSIGADGILHQKNISFEVADSPEEFTNKLLNLATNEQRRKELSSAAINFCSDYNAEILKKMQETFI